MSVLPVRSHPIRSPVVGTRSGEVRHEAGQALRWSASQQKHIAYALSMDPADVSRECNGQQDGTTTKFYERVRQLVREGKTTAGSVIAGAMCVAEEEAVRSLTGPEIRARLMEALSQESLVEGEENAAQHRLAVALGENSTDLRAALEGYDEAVRRESGRAVDALIYARALRVIRGWRAAP